MAPDQQVLEPAVTAGPLVTDPGAALRLLSLLKTGGYRFVTPTPATHRRVLRRADKTRARDVRDVLGWSLPFSRDALPGDLFAALEASGAVAPHPQGWQSRIRVSSIGEDLFIHSAFPPEAEDSVFFGPDTYRFARLIDSALRQVDGVAHLVDVGTGSGVGAVVTARACLPARISVTDVNLSALAIARINLDAAGLQAEYLCGPGLDAVPGPADVITANPPFIAGEEGRTYRDGGDMLGARLSHDWALDGADRLAPGGRFILYTGSAIVDGRDALREALEGRLDAATHRLTYEELDPDIFGGMVGAGAYAEVERIAAVGAVIRRLQG